MRIAHFAKGVKYGTALHTIMYTATGEASDWMLHKRNIFAFSPEIGYNNKAAEDFYPSIKYQRISVA